MLSRMQFIGWLLISTGVFAGGPSGVAGPTRPGVHPPASWKFNFDPQVRRTGYTSISPATIYTPETGYGFDFGTTASSPPFYFSVRVPEGNYNVTATLGDSKSPSTTTIKSGSRRLMV